MKRNAARLFLDGESLTKYKFIPKNPVLDIPCHGVLQWVALGASSHWAHVLKVPPHFTAGLCCVRFPPVGTGAVLAFASTLSLPSHEVCGVLVQAAPLLMRLGTWTFL